jgi:hypothetical protein
MSVGSCLPEQMVACLKFTLAMTLLSRRSIKERSAQRALCRFVENNAIVVFLFVRMAVVSDADSSSIWK